MAHRYGQAKLDAITSLKYGLGNAVYLGSMQDFTRDGQVYNHNFAYPIRYNGERCYVFCRALHDANKNHLYVHEVFVASKIEKGNPLQTAASQPHGGISLYRDILANVLNTANISHSSESASEEGGNMYREGNYSEDNSGKEVESMQEQIAQLAERLHLDNVEVVTDASTLEGKKQRAKGFYDKQTGKITIVLPNHADLADVEQTLLHEAVAHYGLRAGNYGVDRTDVEQTIELQDR